MEVRGLAIYCDHCGKQLDRPGALIFSPPISGFVQKFHLCQDCYEKLIEDIVTRQAPSKRNIWKNTCKCKCR